VNLIDKIKTLFGRKKVDESIFKRFEECSYFVRGYKCSCDCNPCEFAKSDGTMDVEEAKKGEKTCKIHGGCYKKYYRCLAEMDDSDYDYYKSLTPEQMEIYEDLRLKCVR